MAAGVVDVSGDGVNNQGPPVTMIRDELLAKNVTVNGLPIMLKRPLAASMDIENLDVYYEDCVIGGPGSFVVPIKEREKFKEATRTKLVLEIAGHSPPARVMPSHVRGPAHVLPDRRTHVAVSLGRPGGSELRGEPRPIVRDHRSSARIDATISTCGE